MATAAKVNGKLVNISFNIADENFVSSCMHVRSVLPDNLMGMDNSLQFYPPIHTPLLTIVRSIYV